MKDLFHLFWLKQAHFGQRDFFFLNGNSILIKAKQHNRHILRSEQQKDHPGGERSNTQTKFCLPSRDVHGNNRKTIQEEREVIPRPSSASQVGMFMGQA